MTTELFGIFNCQQPWPSASVKDDSRAVWHFQLPAAMDFSLSLLNVLDMHGLHLIFSPWFVHPATRQVYPRFFCMPFGNPEVYRPMDAKKKKIISPNDCRHTVIGEATLTTLLKTITSFCAPCMLDEQAANFKPLLQGHHESMMRHA